MAETLPGLQAERTELAWRRTQISLVVIACLAFRGQQQALAFLAILTAGGLCLGQRSRYRQSQAMLRDECGRGRLLSVLGTGAMVGLMAAMAMLNAIPL